METTTSILGEMEDSKAPRMNRNIAKPVNEVNADMIHKLEPHPKNCNYRQYPSLPDATL